MSETGHIRSITYGIRCVVSVTAFLKSFCRHRILTSTCDFCVKKLGLVDVKPGLSKSMGRIYREGVRIQGAVEKV